MDAPARADPLGEVVEPIVLSVEIEIDKLSFRRVPHSQRQGDLRRDPVQQIGQVKGICQQAELFTGPHPQHALFVREVQIIGALLHMPGAVSPSADLAGAGGILLPIRRADQKLCLLGGLLGLIRIHRGHAAAFCIQIHGRRPGTGKHIQVFLLHIYLRRDHPHPEQTAVYEALRLLSGSVGPHPRFLPASL